MGGVLAGLAIAVAACGGVSSDGSGASGGGKDCEYKLGSLLPLTGAYASLGQSDSIGQKAAVDDVNAGGGVNGCKLSLSIQDTQSQPNIAVTDAQSLLGQHIVGLLGPQPGTEVSAVDPIIKRANIPACVFSNTITITQTGNDNLFRCQTNDADNVKAAILYLKTQVKAKRISIIYSNDGYGTQASAALNNLAKSGPTQIDVASSIQIEATGTDFTSAWNRAMASHPDGIILWTGGASIGVALKNARQIGVNVPIVGGQGLGPPATDAAGAAANGVFGTNLLDPSNLTPEQQHMTDVIQKKFGANTTVNLFTMLSWDAVHLFALGLKNNAKDLKAGLTAVSQAKLAAGTYSFSKTNRNGLGVSSIVITKIENGKPQGVVRGEKLLSDAGA